MDDFSRHQTLNLVVLLLFAFPSPFFAQLHSSGFGFNPSAFPSPPFSPQQWAASTSSSPPLPSPSPLPDDSNASGGAPLQAPSSLPNPRPRGCGPASPRCQGSLYHSRAPPPRQHQGSKEGDVGDGSKKKKEFNFGEKVGLAFLAAAVALQIAFGGFLIHKGRKIRMVVVGRVLERDPSGDSSPLASSHSASA